MDKRTLILDTMHELFQEGIAGTATINDISKRAGIAKGGLYYYFHSKEEVLDAFVERKYELVISNCKTLIQKSDLNAIDKLKLLIETYTNAYHDPSFIAFLHLPNNALIHQKSQANILTALSDIVADIIKDGISEHIFTCEYPKEFSEIFLSTLVFLMDPGIFSWTSEQKSHKLKALASLIESGLHTSDGMFSFLYDNNF